MKQCFSFNENKVLLLMSAGALLIWFGFCEYWDQIENTFWDFHTFSRTVKNSEKSSDIFLRAVPLDEWFGKIPNSDWFSTHQQSHYREVPRWEIFKEQELRFGLDLGRLAVLKKRVLTNFEQLLRVFLYVFRGKKMLKFF